MASVILTPPDGLTPRDGLIPPDGARRAAMSTALATVSAIAAAPSHAIGVLATPATIMTIAIATHGIVSGNCSSGEVSAAG